MCDPGFNPQHGKEAGGAIYFLTRSIYLPVVVHGCVMVFTCRSEERLFHCVGQGIDLGSSGLAVNAFCSLSLITGPVSSLIVVCLVSYLPWILTSMKEG